MVGEVEAFSHLHRNCLICIFIPMDKAKNEREQFEADLSEILTPTKADDQRPAPTPPSTAHSPSSPPASATPSRWVEMVVRLGAIALLLYLLLLFANRIAQG